MLSIIAVPSIVAMITILTCIDTADPIYDYV